MPMVSIALMIIVQEKTMVWIEIIFMIFPAWLIALAAAYLNFLLGLLVDVIPW